MVKDKNVYKNYLKKDRNAYLDDNLQWAKSVHIGDKFGRKAITSKTLNNAERYVKAKEQYNMRAVSVDNIIGYIVEFLTGIGINDAKVIYQECEEPIAYNEIKEICGLKDERDIVWLKFTTSRHLGVVARGRDINFNIPDSIDNYHKFVYKYNDKGDKEKCYVYNTSGILLHSVGGEWDESFVLIVPVKDCKVCDIETGIGNYLISKNVPIIDYYSHNY